jgi:hypothetical protein
MTRQNKLKILPVPFYSGILRMHSIFSCFINKLYINLQYYYNDLHIITNNN